MIKALTSLTAICLVAGCGGINLPYWPWKKTQAPAATTQPQVDATPPAPSTTQQPPAAKVEAAPSPPPVPLSRGQQMLSDGIRQYYLGDYKAASKALQNALVLGLAEKVDQVSAHKFLAFTNCLTNRQQLCRSEFSKALDLYPGFDLDPSEADNPRFGPVFRSVKAAKST